jgi:hypothetical protein
MASREVCQVEISVLTFGRYRGVAVDEIPVGYLIWILRHWEKPARLARLELERRARVMSGRDALEAQASLGQYQAGLARSIGRHRRPKRSGRRVSRHGDRRDRDRQVSYRQEDKLAERVVVVGAAFDRLKQEFLSKGGDPSACRFDAADYVYDGPGIARSGTELIIASQSENKASPPVGEGCPNAYPVAPSSADEAKC